ncbi:hypothetical protein LOC68_26515 [Blastopirellula sp. JC732]|uniref:Carboxypeptidase regulatory-like domain-containing protein n=1 Tax=Blastopirellula sediminis TaxID=2894196 RepID=A0A9X1MT14_9BACT|nr:hypothetical protein [Blastopirellula sediminis]MCC9604736.1 hypothetical protein [Blastopirellula sediminis]MCC9631965.1 hypothetical protein [Blastopirellula sediminis]
MRRKTQFLVTLVARLLLLFVLLSRAETLSHAMAQSEDEQSPAGRYVLHGNCVDQADLSPLAGIAVTLYEVAGMTGAPVEIAKTVSDAEGKFKFTGLVPERRDFALDRLRYDVVGRMPGWAIGKSFFNQINGEYVPTIRLTRETATLRGKVVDIDGQPIAGATVTPYFVNVRPMPEFLSATTDAEGRFQLDGIGIYSWSPTHVVPTHVAVRHPDYPPASGRTKKLPDDITVTMERGCVVQGKVVDSVTGGLADGVLVNAGSIAGGPSQWASTNAVGEFRMVIPEGNYTFRVEKHDRIGLALGETWCGAGQKIDLPPILLIRGGVIAGQVVHAKTGQPIVFTERGERLRLGLYGPSELNRQIAAPRSLVEVDANGRFELRAAPGDNFPYVLNHEANRMSWNTEKQSPVVVKEGETTDYNLLFEPPIASAEKMKDAEALIAELSKDPTERTAQILSAYRQYAHPFEDAEVWACMTRELIALGPQAVPQLIAELDATKHEGMLRRLGFALRAIGDPRAVPALIRAIPKTHVPTGSDCGLRIDSSELTALLRKYDLDEQDRGDWISYERPVGEICGALHKLTGQNFDDMALSSIHLSEDPRRAIMQQRRFDRHAQLWQSWWEQNWRTLTLDEQFATVGLKSEEKPIPPPMAELGPTAKYGNGRIGASLSPVSVQGRYNRHFLDLDTGYEPHPPAAFIKEGAKPTEAEVSAWAAEQGCDLICVPYPTDVGKSAVALKAIDMQVREISLTDARKIKHWIASGKLPEGRQVEDQFLVHYDPKTQRFVPGAESAFLYTTEEGCIGMITIGMPNGEETMIGLEDLNASDVLPRRATFDLREIIP